MESLKISETFFNLFKKFMDFFYTEYIFSHALKYFIEL